MQSVNKNFYDVFEEITWFAFGRKTGLLLSIIDLAMREGVACIGRRVKDIDMVGGFG